MKVIKMKKEAYKELILYATKICDSFSLVKYKKVFPEERVEKRKKVALEIITSNPKYLKENILKKFSLEVLQEIYEEYKNDERIFYGIEYDWNSILLELKSKFYINCYSYLFIFGSVI